MHVVYCMLSKIVEIVKLLILAGLVIVLCACERRDNQFEAEARFAFGVMRSLDEFARTNPGVSVTSLVQLVPTPENYPHNWHDRFKRFGGHAGFTTSIYEKYVFFPAGLTNRWLDGELVAINAQAFPAPRGGMQRTMILRGDERHRYRPVPEAVVQRVLRELGVSEPTAPPRPPPSAPLEVD
jgi:hypothetical protein